MHQLTVCFRTNARQRFNFFTTCNDLEATNLITLELAKFTFSLIIYFSTVENCLCSLYRKKAFTRLRKTKKKWQVTVVVYKKTTIYLTHERSRKEKAAHLASTMSHLDFRFLSMETLASAQRSFFLKVYWDNKDSAELAILHQNWKGYICVNMGQNVVRKILRLY